MIWRRPVLDFFELLGGRYGPDRSTSTAPGRAHTPRHGSKGRFKMSSRVLQAKVDAREAFRDLVENTHSRVYRVALALLQSPHEAEEVVQETFVRAWEAFHELRDPSATTSWLLKIAGNLARDKRRLWRRRSNEPFDEATIEPLRSLLSPEGTIESPDEAVLRKQRADSLRRAVEGLKESHRVVIVLREIEEMTYEEIASALSIPVGTVESRLHRAREKLAKKLRRLVEREKTP